MTGHTTIIDERHWYYRLSEECDPIVAVRQQGALSSSRAQNRGNCVYCIDTHLVGRPVRFSCNFWTCRNIFDLSLKPHL